MSKVVQLQEQTGGTRIIVDDQPIGWLMSTINGQYLFEINKVRYPNCENKDVAIKMLTALINDGTI